VEVLGGEHWNVQTGGGDRVSTISLIGCSTSMSLATGPTDEEDEGRCIGMLLTKPRAWYVQFMIILTDLKEVLRLELK